MDLYTPNSENQLHEDSLALEVTQEQAEEFARELRQLSDLAFLFLSVTDNDRAEAEELLDSFIGLLFESGTLQTWRYRILLAGIRKGL
jgi:hypothetical protein